MMNESLYFSAFLIGLMGAGHCFGMCGGIVGAFQLSLSNQVLSQSKKRFFFGLYHAGRLCSYTLMGSLLGSLGMVFTHTMGWKVLLALRLLSCLMLIVLGLYLLDFWLLLAKLEKIGFVIWRRIQPLTKYFFPVDKAYKALILGLLWGWLPCGLIYSTLTLALSSAQGLAGGTVMLCFGLGTLPAMLLSGVIADKYKKIMHRKVFRVGVGFAFLLFGFVSFNHLVLLQTTGHCH